MKKLSAWLAAALLIPTVVFGQGVYGTNGAGGTGGGAVSSVSGTANQTVVTPTTGATVVSLSPTLVFPGTVTTTSSGIVLPGSSSGSATLVGPATGGGTDTLPQGANNLGAAGIGAILATSPSLTAAQFNNNCPIYTINAASLNVTIPAAGSPLNPNGGCLWISNPSAFTYTITPTGLDNICSAGSCANTPLTVATSTLTLVTSDGAANDFVEPAGAGGSSGFPITLGSTSVASGSTTTTIAGLTLSAPTFTGSVTATGLVTLADLATQATNTVLVNATSGTASPTAQAISGCSTAGDALNWTTNTGFGCAVNGVVNSGTTPDGAYYASSTNAVSDGGSATVTYGGINVTSSTIPANGIYLSAANTLAFAYNSTIGFKLSASNILISKNINSSATGGPEVVDNTSSATVATFVPDNSGSTSGLGGAANVPAMIVSGASIENWSSTGPAILVIPSDAATTDNTLCLNVSGGAEQKGSGTLGTCLGTSSTASAKTSIVMVREGLGTILQLRPKNYFYKKGFGDDGAREQYGFLAEDYAKVLPKLTRFDKSGHPNGVDILGLVPVIVRAIQGIQVEVLVLFVWNILLTGGVGYLFLKRKR